LDRRPFLSRTWQYRSLYRILRYFVLA
jgi:hypothetical protein